MIQAILKALIASKQARREAVIKLGREINCRVETAGIDAEIKSLQESLQQYDTE